MGSRLLKRKRRALSLPQILTVVYFIKENTDAALCMNRILPVMSVTLFGGGGHSRKHTWQRCISSALWQTKREARDRIYTIPRFGTEREMSQAKVCCDELKKAGDVVVEWPSYTSFFVVFACILLPMGQNHSLCSLLTWSLPTGWKHSFQGALIMINSVDRKSVV